MTSRPEKTQMLFGCYHAPQNAKKCAIKDVYLAPFLLVAVHHLASSAPDVVLQLSLAHVVRGNLVKVGLRILSKRRLSQTL